MGAPFTVRERVRWIDCDAAQIIYYGAYIRFFEIAETFRNTSIWQHDGGVWKVPGFLIPDWDWRAPASKATT